MQGLRDDMWPRWVPVAAAAFSLLVGALSLFADTAHERPNPVVFGLIAIATAPWLIEAAGRVLPRPLFAVGVFTPLAVLNIAGGSFGMAMEHDGQLSLMLLTLAVGQLAASVPVRHVPIYGAVAMLVPFGRFLVEPAFSEWVFWAAGLLLATGAGVLLQRQHALVVQLGQAQAALAEEATVQERRRIAREVHDVIAHSLTVSMLHVTAARLAVRRNPADAEEALAEAERLGRQALNDVRRTVGLLHESEAGATDSALPTASDLPELVEAYAAAGQDVRFECSAELSLATPTGGLALYRAVQEGLANAAKHAPGSAVTVTVMLLDDRLVAEVANAYDGQRPPDPNGLGLRGMRERIEALGGSVTAGPTARGWVTSCTIPVGTPP